MPDRSLPAILPAGTQVVTAVEMCDANGGIVRPRGAIGVIIQVPADPWHAYRVRFSDGSEASFKRQALTVLAHFQSSDLDASGPFAGSDFTTT